MSANTDLPDRCFQEFKDIRISGDARVHVGNVYSSACDVLASHEEKDRLAVLRKVLYYDGVYRRQTQIAQARIQEISPESLSWVWHTSIVKWLQSNDSIFWITGKPGSGKSTLMHYLTGNKSTKEFLSHGSRKWTIVYFYFDFRAGTGIENSFEGLLRSILLQLIDKKDEVNLEIAQRHLIRVQENAHFADGEIEEIFCLATCKTKIPICAFFDGLDEYTGNMLQLLRSLKALQSRSGMKMCVASRPENLIQRHFSQFPGFAMQDYNTPSIRAYLRSVLESLVSDEENRSIENLIEEIVRNSNGMILWARFVADEFVQRISEGASVDELREVLHSCPSEIENIYERTLSKLNEASALHAAIILKLVLSHGSSDGFTNSWHFTTCEVLMAASLTVLRKLNTSLAVQEARRSISQFKIRVNAMLGGLLEVHREQYLNVNTYRFVHKTFATYLHRSTWLSRTLGDNFPRLFPTWLWFYVSCEAIEEYRLPRLDTGHDVIKCIRDKEGYSTKEPSHAPRGALSTDQMCESSAKAIESFIRSSVELVICGMNLWCGHNEMKLYFLSKVVFYPLLAILTIQNASCRRCRKFRVDEIEHEFECSKFPVIYQMISHGCFPIVDSFLRTHGTLIGPLEKAWLLNIVHQFYDITYRYSYTSVVRLLFAQAELGARQLSLLLHNFYWLKDAAILSQLEMCAQNLHIRSAENCCEAVSSRNKPHPIGGLFLCWIFSSISDLEALSARLKLSLRLGLDLYEPCYDKPTVFHVLIDREGWAIPRWSQKLMLLLRTGYELPSDLREGLGISQLEQGLERCGERSNQADELLMLHKPRAWHINHVHPKSKEMSLMKRCRIWRKRRAETTRVLEMFRDYLQNGYFPLREPDAFTTYRLELNSELEDSSTSPSSVSSYISDADAESDFSDDDETSQH